jgi:hypothetical protein
MLSEGLECLFNLAIHMNTSEAIWKIHRVENRKKIPPLSELNTPQTVRRAPTYVTYSLYPTTKYGTGLTTINNYHASKLSSGQGETPTPLISRSSTNSVLSTPLSNISSLAHTKMCISQDNSFQKLPSLNPQAIQNVKKLQKDDKNNTKDDLEGYDFCHIMVELMIRLHNDSELLAQIISVCIAMFNHHPTRIKFLSTQNALIKKIQKIKDEVIKKGESEKIKTISSQSSDSEVATSLFSHFFNIINFK